MTVTTRVDLAILGIRGRTPVSRPAGAGPSADGHLVLDGASVAVPLNDASPYWLDGATLMRDGVVVEDVAVEPVRRPRFYDLTTSDGVAYEQLARLHGRDVLATTVVQTCIRYDAAERCRFCAIEESLTAGSTTAVKRPYELAEVAEAAVRLDGVRQMVMT
ncbi:MAG: radical SAM protein, partial [Propionibacteriaceae bacterium]